MNELAVVGVLLDGVTYVITVFEGIVVGELGLAVLGSLEEVLVFVAERGVVAVGVDFVVAKVVDAVNSDAGGFEKVHFVEHVVLLVHQVGLGQNETVHSSQTGEVKLSVVPAGFGARADSDAETVADVVTVDGFGGEQVVSIQDGRPLQFEEDGLSFGCGVTKVVRVGSGVASVEEGVVGDKVVAF